MVATQMAMAVSERRTIDIEAIDEISRSEYLLRTTVTKIKVLGFKTLYTETNEELDEEDSNNSVIPELKEGDSPKLVALFPEQHFTKPPPRFTEATLVKSLEENGIGRPSTYADTIATIQRRYTTKVNGAFEPTEAAFVVTDLLKQFFPEIVDIQFTARMEEDLDEIASGNLTWVGVLEDFHTPFQKRLEFAKTNMQRVRLPDKVTTEVCPECSTRYGLTRYLLVKTGPTGMFLGCPGYQDQDNPCDYTQPYRIRTGVRCPEPDCDGEIVELINNRRRLFHGCSNYPVCTFKTNNKPLPEPCSECGGLLTIYRNQSAKCIKCRHQEQIEPDNDIQTDASS